MDHSRHQGNCPSVVMHQILLEENAKTSREPFKPYFEEMVRAEIIKLLDAGIIYLISDSYSVSPVQVGPESQLLLMRTMNWF